MKKAILILLACLPALGLWAQEKPIQIVFDVSSGNPEVHESATRHIDLMSAAYPDSQFEMVIYSGAIDLVRKDGSPTGETMRKILARKNVSVKVCQLTMDRHHMGKEDLIPGITAVPDGIYEIISKQQQGWGYIKEGH